jgi:hypothetical protein
MAATRPFVAHPATKELRRKGHSPLFPARALLFFRSTSQRMGLSSYHQRERLQLLLSRGKDRQTVHGSSSHEARELRGFFPLICIPERLLFRTFRRHVSRIQKVLFSVSPTFLCPFFFPTAFSSWLATSLRSNASLDGEGCRETQE